GNRLDRDAKIDRLAVGHTAGDAARPVGQVSETAFLVVDLVVKVRAAPGRALESCTELDALDGVDRHHGLRQLAVELAVPVHVAAQAWRNTSRAHAEGSAQSVAKFGALVDLAPHARRGS